MLYTQCGSHIYSLAATGIKFKSKEFLSRHDANTFMYRFMAKKGLKIVEIWNDRHDKTYCCQDGIKFYVNRF